MTDKTFEDIIKDRKFKELISILTDKLPSIPNDIGNLQSLIDHLSTNVDNRARTYDQRFNNLESMIDSRFDAYKACMNQEWDDFLSDLPEYDMNNLNRRISAIEKDDKLDKLRSRLNIYGYIILGQLGVIYAVVSYIPGLQDNMIIKLIGKLVKMVIGVIL